MFSPVPKGKHLTEGGESEGEGDGVDYADAREDSNDDSEESEEVDSPPRTELRSELNPDQAANQGIRPRCRLSGTRSTLGPQLQIREKTVKQPKVAQSKCRKALPRIKVAVPIAST